MSFLRMKSNFYHTFSCKVGQLLMLLCAVFLFSQDAPNLKEIKKQVNSISSIYNYDKLVFKLRGMPQSLDSLEAKHLYYGKMFTDYSINPTDQDYKDFTKAFQERDYTKAIPFGENLTFKDPSNIEILFLLLQCYEQVQDQKKFVYTLQKFRAMTATVMTSGNGETENSAYIVNSVGEEYVLLNVLKIPFQSYQRSSKTVKDGTFDVWVKDKDKIYIKVLNSFD